MNICKIFSTDERVRILEEVIFNSGQFGVNEVARKLGLSKGLLSRQLDLLARQGLLKRKKQKFVVASNSSVKSVRLMLTIQKIGVAVFKWHGIVKAAGLYGSGAKGTNTKDSDVDLWVKVGRGSDPSEVISVASAIRKGIEKAQVLILDDDKLREIKKADPLFYRSLFFGSIIVYGDENAL